VCVILIGICVFLCIKKFGICSEGTLMCIISVKIKGFDLPKEEHLRNCESRNKDGMGIAYLKEGKNEVIIKKDFKDLEEFIKWFYDNIKKEDTCVIHFRYATHGLVDSGNRHPFPVTKNTGLLRETNVVCQMAVAHNGVISQYGTHVTFSDTQKFIMDILADDVVKDNISNPTVRKLVSNFLSGDRMAVLMNTGIVYMWGSWVKEGELYYSNDGFRTASPMINIQQAWSKYNERELCDGCGELKHVKIIDENDKFLVLCKPCRKKYRKGTLILKPITLLKSTSTYDEELEKLTLSEEQCESCLTWKEKSEIVIYYGHRICSRCLEDVTELERNR